MRLLWIDGRRVFFLFVLGGSTGLCKMIVSRDCFIPLFCTSVVTGMQAILLSLLEETIALALW